MTIIVPAGAEQRQGALYRAQLKLSDSLASRNLPDEIDLHVSDPFTLMQALVNGSDNHGRWFAHPALLHQLAWWQEDWDRETVQSWLDSLVEWGEVTVEPLGRNCYSPDETFDVVVIQDRRRFRRWRARPPFTTRQRVEVYARDGGACVHCGTTESLSIDHIVPWSKGGAHEMDNFQTLCCPCNSRKGARV